MLAGGLGGAGLFAISLHPRALTLNLRNAPGDVAMTSVAHQARNGEHSGGQERRSHR